MRVGVCAALKVAGGSAGSASTTWWSGGGADVSTDVRVVVAPSVDADELARAVVEVVAWAVAGGECVYESE